MFANILVALYVLVPLALVLWLIKRFITLGDDVHYLANQARKANGEEIPKTDPRVTAVIVVVAIVAICFAFAQSSCNF